MEPHARHRLTVHPSDEGGFTLIELLVVIAIIGILVALLQEAIQDHRKSANELTAVATLNDVVAAQDRFSDDDGRWAGSLAELADANPELLGHLADGEDGGYLFDVHPVDPGDWVATATPGALGVSGGSTFVTDSTGVIREQDCRLGQVWDHQQGRCVADPSGVISAQAGTTIRMLDRLGFGLALEPAGELAGDDAFVATVGRHVDADGDGQLTPEEALGADPFAIAQALVGDPADPREVIGGEEEARTAWAAYQRWLTGFLQLGVADEGQVSAVPIPANDGSAAALIGSVPGVSAAESLGFLHDHVAGLDVRADPLGDMAHRDSDVNAERQRVLLRDVERMIRCLEDDMDGALEAHLVRIRARADGDAEVEDWVVGPAATRVVAQIDLTLDAHRG